jgi:hypothetical protein
MSDEDSDEVGLAGVGAVRRRALRANGHRDEP